MTPSTTPPRIEDLMASFLARRQFEQAMGSEAIRSSELESYEAVPAQSVDPKQAWDAAVEPLNLLSSTATKLSKVASGWSGLVNESAAQMGVPCALGNFPQSVRDLLPLVRAERFSGAFNKSASANEDAALTAWVANASRTDDPAKWLLAAGVLRFANRFDEAAAILDGKTFPANWATVRANELAALAWQRGDIATARQYWQSMPDSAVKSFNLGMADLFSDNYASAQSHLKAAVEGLADSSPWHHLGRLYLALAASRDR